MIEARVAEGQDPLAGIPITAGTHSIAWTATKNDHLTVTPQCADLYTVDGPDVVLVYQPSFDGSIDFSAGQATIGLGIGSNQ